MLEDLELQRGRALRRLALMAWLSAAAFGGCLYDASDRCGPQQRLTRGQTCVCTEGLVLQNGSCEPCPAHEMAVNGRCDCEEGYERSVAGQACTPVVVGGPGVSCSDTEPCADPAFPRCQAGGVQGQYCTNTDCSSNDDCQEGFDCRRVPGQTSYCERPPLGQGKSCASQEDCAGADASLCDTFRSRMCLVPNCSLTRPDCSPGWECCDLSSVQFPGIPASVCVPEGRCTL